MVALGVLLATSLLRAYVAKDKELSEKIIDMACFVVIWGIIGGRVLYVLLNLNYYLNAPLDIFKIYEGGLAFHGSFIFGLLSLLFFLKKNKLPVLETLDKVVIFLPLAHALGRIGCFFNGCCYGYPTDVFRGTFLEKCFGCLHPVQLYSSLCLTGIFFLLFAADRKKRFAGQILSLYLILYGICRFLLEFLRADNASVFFKLSLFQIISIVLFLTGVSLYLQLSKKNG